MNYEYFIFNLIIIICPFIVKLCIPRIDIPSIKKSYLAIVIPALIFIIWDHMVTGYFWSFNHLYIVNIYVGHIPIEEVLFFFTTSYTCLFVWLVLNRSATMRDAPVYIPVSILILSTFFSLWFVKLKLWYSLLVMVGVILTICIDHMLKTKIYSKKISYLFMLIIIGFTSLFNFYLTSRPVVLYNKNVKTNIMIGPIPLEDFVYGLVLIISVIILYEYVNKSRRAYQKAQ